MDNFQALSKAGIGSAYSAINNECIDQLQCHTTKLSNKASHETALTKVAYIINTIQSNQSDAAPSTAASRPPTEIETILVAITNLQRPVPPVAKQKKEMQQILVLLTAKVGSKNADYGGGNGGGNQNIRSNNNNNNNCNKGQHVSVTPNLRYNFYCWSHGIIPTHDSCKCLNKFPGHQDGAVYTNQMGGW